MWLINVVVIITFVYLLFKNIQNNKENKKIEVYIIMVIAIIFEIILISNVVLEQEISNFVQLLILLFAYFIPAYLIVFNNNNILKLKILYAIAYISYSYKKYELCEEILVGLIKIDKQNTKLYYLRAQALIKLKDFEKARDMLFIVVSVDKTNKEAYIKLIELLEEEKKLDTAYVMLNKFIKMYPEDTNANELLGIIYSELGKEKEAESIYEALSKNDNGTYKTYYNLAIIYSRQGEIKKAIESYKIAVEKNAKLYEAYYALGNLLYIEGEYEESIRYLRYALKDERLNARTNYAMSMSYIKLDELDKAIICLEESIKLDKNYLIKAKQNEIFDALALDIARIEDENKNLITVTYDENELKENVY